MFLLRTFNHNVKPWRKKTITKFNKLIKIKSIFINVGLIERVTLEFVNLFYLNFFIILMYFPTF